MRDQASGYDPSQHKLLRSRIRKATEMRKLWDPILVDLYDYVVPYRRAFYNSDSGYTQGQKLTDKLFDSTAVDAAFRFTGRMQQEITPPFQPFFELFTGPLLRMAPDQRKQVDEQLGDISTQVTGALTASNFHLSSGEMYTDLFTSTGYLLMLEGDAKQPIRCLCAPPFEMAMDLGPWGEIAGRYWTRQWPAWQLPEMWPNGRFSDELLQQIKS